jgi:hypothetical protein
MRLDAFINKKASRHIRIFWKRVGLPIYWEALTVTVMLPAAQVQNGSIYEYQVEAVMINGGSKWSDIARVDARFRTYLPMLER